MGAVFADALSRIARVSDEIGTCVVVLDVFEDADPDAVVRRKTEYEDFGFISFPGLPLRLFMPIQTARALWNDKPLSAGFSRFQKFAISSWADQAFCLPENRRKALNDH